MIYKACITLEKDNKSPSPYSGGIILVHPQGWWKGAFIYEIDIGVGTGWEKIREKIKMGETSF